MNLFNRSANARIIVNTGILYFQLVFTIVVNLVATRLILNAMGVEDFGIVNLISGIVALLSFFQNSLTISTQRYLSVNKGKNDLDSQLEIFNTSIVIHLLLGVLVVVLLESITPIIFNSSIQIPAERLTMSQMLYQLTIVGTFFVIIAVPYDATINAHENMLLFSIATIIESLIRLVGAIVLVGYRSDKLLFYGVLLITIRLVSLLIKATYCRLNYKDSKIDFKKYRKNHLKMMLSFAGWNVIGGFSVSLRSQGMAIVLNIFQGVVLNAAYGIANQVSGQLSNFAATLSKAMAPQIMQSKGSGDTNHMISLSFKQCKYSFILLLFFVIPMYIGMPFILRLWLKQIPDYTIDFCKLILIVAMIQQVTIGLQTLIQANGRIAVYQSLMSVFIMLNIPLAYFVLKIGWHPNFVIIAMIFVELICMVARIIISQKIVGYQYKEIIDELLKPILIIATFSTVILVLLSKISSSMGDIESIIVSSVTGWGALLVLTFVTFTKTEKKYFIESAKKIRKRI